MKTFTTCIFIVINENKARKEFFFSPSNNPLLAKAQISISTQLGWKKSKSKFQNINFVLLPNVVSHIISAFYQKILPYLDKKFWNCVFFRFLLVLEVRETGAWRGWATQFFNWLSKFSALLFSDGSKKYQTWFEWCSNSKFFNKKKTKHNCPAARGSTARPRLWCAWVKPLCLARRPIATFLGITWSLGAQSWTALFRAFRSHRQTSASLTKLFPSLARLWAELDKPQGSSWEITLLEKLRAADES